MKKRVQGLKKCLAAILAFMILAGCGRPTLEIQEEGGESVAVQEDAGASVTEKDVGFQEEGYPIVEEPITLRIAVNRVVDDKRKSLNDIEYLKELEEKTNIKIEWIEIGNTAWNEKKNLMFVSGDLPDAFLGEGISDMDILTNQNSFIPLNDLIEEYAPNINACFEKEPELRSVVEGEDGNIYSLFRYRGSYYPNTMDVMAINKTWLDTLGLEVPTTTEELYEVLKKFKTEDPNGNGIQDEIPLILYHQMGNATNSEANFFPPFGVYDNTSYSELTYHMMVKDGKPVFTPAQEGYKEALKYLNRLYSEGLLDPEMFTMTGDTYSAKCQDENDIIGAFVGWTLSNSVGFERAEEDFIQLAPLKGPQGEQGWTVVSDMQIGRNMFEITSANPYPEATMRWIDEWYSQDMSIQTFYGPYGVMTEKQEDGTVVAFEPPEGYTYGEWRWGNCPADSAPYACFPEFEEILTPARQQMDRDIFQKGVEPYLQEEIYPNVFFSLEQINALKKIIPDINSYEEMMRAKFVCEGNIDEQWDEYLQQLDKLGLPEAMEIYNTAYDNYLKAE